MKKRWIFLTVCVVAVAAFSVTRNTEAEPVTVNTTILQASVVEQTVTCNGVVESQQALGVYPPLACVIEEVLVETGQQVMAGEPLALIDKEASKNVQLSNNRVGDALALTTMPAVITAPEDGIVLSVEVTAGMVADTAVPCVTMAARDDLQVRVLIREKFLPSLDVGQAVRVSGAGFDKKVYYGHLSEISSSASSTVTSGERTVEGVIALDEGQADASMRLGLSAKAKVIISTVEDGIIIPYEAAIQTTDGDYYVYFVQGGKTVTCQLTPREELADGLLVDAADFAGRVLVTEPDKVTEDGMPIQVQEDGA